MENPLLNLEFPIPFDRIRPEHVVPAIEALIENARRGVEDLTRHRLNLNIFQTEVPMVEPSPQDGQRSLADILESIADPVVAFDKQWRYTYVSRRAAQALGKSQEEMIGKSMWDLFPKDVETGFQEACQRAWMERTPVTIERYSNVQQAWVENYIFPFEDGASTEWRDITARKLSEQARERETELLQGIVKNIPVMLCLYDPRLNTINLNHEFERVLGWTTADADGGDLMAKVYPDPAYRAMAADYMQSLAPGWREFSLMAKDGAQIPSEWANVRLSDERIIGIGINLSARRAGEAREREQAAELQAVMEAVPVATFISHDPDCRKIVGNRMTYELLRLPPGTNLSKSALEAEMSTAFRIVDKGHEIPPSELPVQKAASTGEPIRNYEFDVVLDDGSRRCMLGDAVPLLGEDGRPRGAVGAFLDITERKRNEERLRQTQKLESVGLLAGGIAHDFNNLLTGVMGNASILLEDVGGEQAELARGIIVSAERAAHLTRQLLAYSGKGQVVVRHLDVSQAVNEMADLVQFSIPKSVSLALNLERRLAMVAMDPSQLQQILMNLVINAGEAIGEGNPGRITVATSKTDVQTPFTDAIGEEIAPGRYVTIEVSDTGSGVDLEKKAKIFDPFFTSKFTGRGLGLAAVAGILRSQKGGILLESTPGKGSTFRVLLPIVRTNRDRAAEFSDTDGRTTVLVVDDEGSVRDFIGSVLRRKGYHVLQASDGQEALTVCQGVTGDIDAAIVNIVMPNMAPSELLPALKAKQPEIKILLTSGYSESEARLLCAAYPNDAFIQKPYTAQQLAKALGNLPGVEEAT